MKPVRNKPCVGCDKKKPTKKQKLSDTDCAHRSSSYRLEGCETCGGSVKFKVFQCLLHTECTLSSQLDAIQNCNNCLDRQAITNSRDK
jgi:hypothetical protein